LLPISLGDKAQRPWIDQPPWPFDVTDLDSYLGEIETLMGVDHASYEEDAASLLDSSGILPRDDADFAQRWPKRPNATDLNIAHALRDHIANYQNIDIWLGATVSTFTFDPQGDRVDEIVAVDHHGHSLTVRADEFVIAAGALESTRLALLADRQSGGAISRDSDALGRYFNDHFGINVATVRPIRRRLTNRAFADRWISGGNRHLHFELKPTAQQSAGIGSTYFDFGVDLPETSALTQARRMLQAVTQRRIVDAIKSVGPILADLPTLFKTALWAYRRKHKYWPANAEVQLKIWVEQLPCRGNRITLSETVDALGQPLMHFDFRKTDDEERALRVTIEKIRAFWERNMCGVALLDWIPEVSDPGVRLIDLSVELAHPAGSTRMGIDPTESVVDPWLRVHSVSNLSIASASVFPTSGSANPTLTIMQLAMRATDAVAARLQSQRHAPGTVGEVPIS
jgi:choline dehydrogenase-like flavoprotein